MTLKIRGADCVLCYFGSIKIMEAYCVGRVHNMLHIPWKYYNN